MLNKNLQLNKLNLFYRLPICHRLPDRTFKFRESYFPVCARCTGIYVSAFTYFIYVYFFYVEYTFQLLLLAFIMTIPTIFDGLTQLFGLRLSNNKLRFFTGLIGGLGLAILIKTLKYYMLT